MWPRQWNLLPTEGRRHVAATLLKTNHLVFLSSRLLLICLVLNVLMSSYLTPARAYDRSIAKATDATQTLTGEISGCELTI